MDSNRRDVINFAVGCLASIAIILGLALIAMTANSRADELRIKQEETEQVRIESCTSIEDGGTRAACIGARQ